MAVRPEVRTPQSAKPSKAKTDDRAVCSKCGYDAVRRSRVRWYDGPLVLTLFLPYRCNKCYRRFYRPRWP